MDLLNANDHAGEYPPSFYAASNTPLPLQPSATGDMRVDVAVIGGGFTGLSSAYHLAKRGYKVAVLEAQRIGFGASGRNGGQVGRGQRVHQDALEDMVGHEVARKLWDIAEASVALVKSLAATDAVKADFQDGIIYADHRASYRDDSRAYLDKLRGEYDVTDMHDLDRDALRELVKTDAYHGGTLDMGSGHIDPLALALGLARLAMDTGATIYEDSRVTEINDGDKPVVKTTNAKITCDHLILACNGYLGDLQPDVAARVMPINNFIAATRPLSDAERNAVLTKNYAVADSKFVVNYFRMSDDNRLLFGGTESYGYKFPTDIATNVRKPLHQIFPQLDGIEIDYAWGGTLGITMNRMPHFTRLGKSTLSASGYSGHGVAMATFAGKMLADTIAGQADQFDIMANVPTHRFPGGTIARQPLLVAAMLWYQLRDKLG